MNPLGQAFLRGIYVSPASVVAAPDYARRLVEEAGVNLFVLRGGFDPLHEDPELTRAVEVIGDLKAAWWLLVGAWWGQGVQVGTDRMRPVGGWRSYGPDWAHEARWNMRTPGGPADDEIALALEGLVKRYAPAGICLTHARFKHPADIAGLFEVGQGAFAEQMAVANVSAELLEGASRRVQRALKDRSASALSAVEGLRLEAFLDGLSDSVVFTRWFALRCQILQRSLSRFHATVKNMSPQVAFGSNAYHPMGARLCGQDYAALSQTCDFLQPLLGYMRWHSLQPVGVWARYLLERTAGLAEADAVRLAAGLMGMDSLSFPTSVAEYPKGDEGPAELTLATVTRQLELCLPLRDARMRVMPVLRGKDWPKEIIRHVAKTAESMNFAGILYQGTEALLGPPPDQGWS